MTDVHGEQTIAGRGETATQVRTFLIADIRGYTRFTQDRGDEAAAELATIFASLVREVVNERGGRVVEFRGDEALCVFESARQALRAATDLQGRFAQHSVERTELPLPAGIGLDAGEAIPVEGGYRGGALNLASRLCSLAGPSEVLASEAVTHLAGRIETLAYIERGAMDLKGIAQPVRVVSIEPSTPGSTPAVGDQPTAHGSRLTAHSSLPIGSFLGSLPAAELVGRQDELERIGGVLDRVVDGVGQLLALSGGQGMGKTRLAQEITRLVHNREFAIATGRCYEPQRAVSYYPFVEALTAAFEAASPAMRTTVARQWPQLGRILPEQVVATPTPSPDPGEEQLRLFRAVAGFLAALARERPVALMLDDLQWADDGSIALLQHLARNLRGSGVLLLAAYRDNEADRSATLDRAVRDLTREGLLERITVQRLSREDTAAMIAATIGDMEASEEFAEYVYRRSRGNPFFIDEMLRALGGRYRIVREIGAGGMGRVFEAVDMRTGKTVAAKLMFATSEANFDALLRFQQEGAVLATLKHPNIVEVLGTFTEEHASCIVMELLNGRSLGEIQRAETLDRPTPASRLPRIKTLMQQTADALAYAHGKSIVHRDVKPDNIIVLDGDRVKVTDFGIARILRPDATMATMQSTGMSLGTPLYMAPEQVEGKRVDGRADIYSLGAVMYGLVAGRPPFEGNDPVTIAYKHVHEAPAPPSEIADVPADWEVLILKALAKDPADRFRTAGDMKSAIDALSLEPGRVQRPARPPQAGPPASQPPKHAPLSTEWRPQPPEPAVPPAPLPAVWQPQEPALPPETAPPVPAVPPIPGVEGLERLGDQISALVQDRVSQKLGQLDVRPAAREQMRDIAQQKREAAREARHQRTQSRRGRGRRRDPSSWPLNLIALALIVAVIIAILLIRAHGSASAHYAFGKPDLAYGLPPPSPPPITAPGAMASDASGNLFVADTIKGTIRELSPDGNPVAFWPAASSKARLGMPTSVGVDAAGNLYVSDAQNNKVIKLNPSGAVLKAWPPQSGGNLNSGVNPSVEHLAVDPAGHVYVVNTAARRIEAYSPSGTYVTQWPIPYYGTPGTVVYDYPSVAVDARGHVYVPDEQARQVLVFSSKGKLLRRLGSFGSGPGQFQIISALACDARGNLYVADHFNSATGHNYGRVQELTPSGKLITTWGSVDTSSTEFTAIPGLAAGTSGALYVANPGDETVKKLSATNTLLASWNGTRSSSSGRVRHPYGITVDQHGHVLTSETQRQQIDVLSPGGQLLTAWKRFGTIPFQAPENMATDSRGNIYLTDASANRVYEFTAEGKPIRIIGSAGLLSAPYAVAVASDGSLYIADSGNYRVVKLSPQGKQEASWTNPITGQAIASVGLGADGSVYATTSSYLYKLSKDLSQLARWGGVGSGPGLFNGVSGITTDNKGDIFVADSGNDRIQVFSTDGTFLAQLGGSGSGPGEFNNPNAVTVDATGNVYVADTGNNRVQKFFAGG